MELKTNATGDVDDFPETITYACLQIYDKFKQMKPEKYHALRDRFPNIRFFQANYNIFRRDERCGCGYCGNGPESWLYGHVRIDRLNVNQQINRFNAQRFPAFVIWENNKWSILYTQREIEDKLEELEG